MKRLTRMLLAVMCLAPYAWAGFEIGNGSVDEVAGFEIGNGRAFYRSDLGDISFRYPEAAFEERFDEAHVRITLPADSQGLPTRLQVGVEEMPLSAIREFLENWLVNPRLGVETIAGLRGVRQDHGKHRTEVRLFNPAGYLVKINVHSPIAANQRLSDPKVKSILDSIQFKAGS